jgi:lipase
MNDKSYQATQDTFDVPVAGGTLRVRTWGKSGPVVLCVHGITANHTQFQWFADQLAGECRLVAPDLRGRGRSNNIKGPWGMAAHAADVVAVLDHLGIAKVDVLLGHSMGGFVAAVAAARYPDRFAQVVMVDGGVPLFNVAFIAYLPFSQFWVEKLTQKIIGPSLTRLGMTFADRAAYHAFWQPHPALAGQWGPHLAQYIDYDLEGEPPAMRPSTNKEALLLDVRTQLVEDIVPRSLKEIRVPVRFLRAPRGVMNDKALYDEQKLARAAKAIPQFSAVTIPDVNHYTIMLSAHGSKAVADEVRKLLPR